MMKSNAMERSDGGPSETSQDLKPRLRQPGGGIGSQPRVTEELVRLLAHLADLQIPEASRESLAGALEQHIVALRRFPLSELPEADPEIAFDPRWE